MSLSHFQYQGKLYAHHPVTMWVYQCVFCERGKLVSHLTSTHIQNAHRRWEKVGSTRSLGLPHSGTIQGKSKSVLLKRGKISSCDVFVNAARWEAVDLPGEDTCNSHLPPLSRPQAEFFCTILQKVDRESSDALLDICADFICNDDMYIQTLAFHGSIKPSTRNTYISGLRQLIRWMSIHLKTPKDLDPFSLVTHIKGGGLKKSHVMKFLVYRLVREKVNFRTVNVNLAAINWAWRVARHEKLLHEGDLFFQEFLSALKKKYQTEVKGSDILGALECVAFFTFLREYAVNQSESLFALAVECAKVFMARESEILNLKTEDVHFSKEVIDFQHTEMVTLVFKDPKSGTQVQPQSVSFEVDSTKRGRAIRLLFQRIAEAKGTKKTQYFFSRFPRKKMGEKRFRNYIKDAWSAFIECPEYQHLAKKKITFHSFRSSGICDLFNSGIQIDLIRVLARHAQWSTTFDSYVKKSRRFTRRGC